MTISQELLTMPFFAGILTIVAMIRRVMEVARVSGLANSQHCDTITRDLEVSARQDALAAANFYAVAYQDASGNIVISYRGTDDPVGDLAGWMGGNGRRGHLVRGVARSGGRHKRLRAVTGPSAAAIRAIQAAVPS